MWRSYCLLLTVVSMIARWDVQQRATGSSRSPREHCERYIASQYRANLFTGGASLLICGSWSTPAPCIDPPGMQTKQNLLSESDIQWTGAASTSPQCVTSTRRCLELFMKCSRHLRCHLRCCIAAAATRKHRWGVHCRVAY